MLPITADRKDREDPVHIVHVLLCYDNTCPVPMDYIEAIRGNRFDLKYVGSHAPAGKEERKGAAWLYAFYISFAFRSLSLRVSTAQSSRSHDPGC